jgi:hypothetical protein
LPGRPVDAADEILESPQYELRRAERQETKKQLTETDKSRQVRRRTKKTGAAFKIAVVLSVILNLIPIEIVMGVEEGY